MFFAGRVDDVARVRDALAAADFTFAGVDAVLGPVGWGFLARGELGPLLRRTSEGSALDTLIRLFVCDIAVDHDAAARALAPLGLAVCADESLVVLDGDRVSAAVNLRPVDVDGTSRLVPFDSDRRRHTADYVVGVGPASMTVAGLTIRQPVARCLDLGTGSGIQAMFAAPHADAIVATDRNPRAVALTEFAMRLNGIGNVEARTGDLFAPVHGEMFDLIVSNPPFVISPGEEFVYRDSGLVGDEVCRRIVSEAPAHLSEGGWCQLLANWAHLRGVDWQSRLAAWVDDLGCDAWIVQSRVEDAETYAATWLRHDYSSEEAAARFDAWMNHYDEIGLEAVGFGLITLRRTTRDDRWVCIEQLARDFALPCGDDIAAAFDRGVWLAAHDDRALLDARLVVSPRMALRQSRFAAEGEWFLDASALEFDDGLRYATGLDSFGSDLVAGCDGTTTVGVLVQRLADAVGLDVSAVSPATIDFVRRLVQQGFVTPIS